jgi:hypothetical protein
VFHISTHTSPHLSSERHPPADASHADQGRMAHASAPLSLTPGTDFLAPGATGSPSGLLGHLPVSDAGWVAVTLPGDSSAYYVKSGAGDGLHPLYTRDPGTGMYRQTSKQVVPDSKGGWQADSGLKGGVNDSPEARAERLREAQAQETQASRQFLQATEDARAAELNVREINNKISYLKEAIGQTERKIENMTRTVERYEAAYSKTENDLIGASNQLTARRNQASQQPQDAAAQDRLAIAQERYDTALRDRDSEHDQLRLTRSLLAVEQSDLNLQRRLLAGDQNDLSVAQTQLTSAENALAAANVKLEQARNELTSAQR